MGANTYCVIYIYIIYIYVCVCVCVCGYMMLHKMYYTIQSLILRETTTVSCAIRVSIYMYVGTIGTVITICIGKI